MLFKFTLEAARTVGALGEPLQESVPKNKELVVYFGVAKIGGNQGLTKMNFKKPEGYSIPSFIL